MEILGYALGAIAALLVAYAIGYRKAEERAERSYGSRMAGLEAAVRKAQTEIARLDACTLQWTYDGEPAGGPAGMVWRNSA